MASCQYFCCTAPAKREPQTSQPGILDVIKTNCNNSSVLLSFHHGPKIRLMSHVLFHVDILITSRSGTMPAGSGGLSRKTAGRMDLITTRASSGLPPHLLQ
jgi:hypothetical protein